MVTHTMNKMAAGGINDHINKVCLSCVGSVSNLENLKYKTNYIIPSFNKSVMNTHVIANVATNYPIEVDLVVFSRFPQF